MTSRLNYDREPRFYANLGFDGGVWYMKDGVAGGSDRNTYFVKAKNGERAGLGHFTNWNETGYFIKKLVHWESSSNLSTSWKQYPWPEIRLADLYLMYAEALNEVQPASATAIEYIDKIRKRAGLKGWQMPGARIQPIPASTAHRPACGRSSNANASLSLLSKDSVIGILNVGRSPMRN